MSDSASPAERNVDAVRRCLRVLETREVAELEDLVAEDVLVHGAGQHLQGRRDQRRDQ